MRTWALFLILLPAFLALEAPEQCDEFGCWSRKDLLKALDRYKQQLDTIRSQLSQTSRKPVVARFDDESSTTEGETATPGSTAAIFWPSPTTYDPAPTCSICNSQPCQNGGTCMVNTTDPWHSWTCECLGNYTGNACETLVKCEPTTCGINAQCSVSNHQANCVCNQGYTGNPKTGCTVKRVSSCIYGDPHYTTFDGLQFDYQGTCPIVFSQPCTSLDGGYDNFKVVHKNDGAYYSYVQQVDITMFGQQIHFDRNRRTMYFNKIQVGYPYYWPSSSNRTITLDFQGSTMSATSNQEVEVTFTTLGALCLYVPDYPEFRGVDALCGLAGNIDGNINNDVGFRNGTIYPVTGQYPNNADPIGFNRAEDTWIEKNFFVTSGDGTCSTGETYSNNSNCNVVPAQQACAPIQNAANGVGPFALCQPMGNDTIQQLYDNCVYDVCHSMPKCSALTDFVQQCMTDLPDTDLGPWRSATNCPKTDCGPHSSYSSCTSACPATCEDHEAPSSCDKGCVDDCQCNYGFVVDNSVTTGTVCIPIQECGCADPDGNMHGADEPWLTPNCSVAAICRNGTYNSEPVQCNQYAFCGPDADHETACQCDPGFRGNGFNCTDINECVEDPSSCGQDQGLGSCTNTIGSYNCTCNLYQTGRDCQDFMPTRHCADYVRYWNATDDGVYSLHLPALDEQGTDFSNVEVYCDMTTDGGGWTLMSHDNGSLMAGRYYEEYENGFGDADLMEAWIGLKVINYLTNSSTNSLRVVIFRCAMRNNPAETTDCTYPAFYVYGSETNYTVNIPEYCEGTETAKSSWDGWVRWPTTGDGPQFTSFDHHDSADCPNAFLSTGWWYSSRCGVADLNGVRFSCDDIPNDPFSYIQWGGNPIGDAWMYLRPADFPNY